MANKPTKKLKKTTIKNKSAVTKGTGGLMNTPFRFNKKLIIAVVALVAIVGGYYVYSSSAARLTRTGILGQTKDEYSRLPGETTVFDTLPRLKDWSIVGRSANAKGQIIEARACMYSYQEPSRDPIPLTHVSFAIRPTNRLSPKDNIGGQPIIRDTVYWGPKYLVSNVRANLKNATYYGTRFNGNYAKSSGGPRMTAQGLVLQNGGGFGSFAVALNDEKTNEENYIVFVTSDYTKTHWKQSQPFSLKALKANTCQR